MAVNSATASPPTEGDALPGARTPARLNLGVVQRIHEGLMDDASVSSPPRTHVSWLLMNPTCARKSIKAPPGCRRVSNETWLTCTPYWNAMGSKLKSCWLLLNETITRPAACAGDTHCALSASTKLAGTRDELNLHTSSDRVAARRKKCAPWMLTSAPP